MRKSKMKEFSWKTHEEYLQKLFGKRKAVEGVDSNSVLEHIANCTDFADTNKYGYLNGPFADVDGNTWADGLANLQAYKRDAPKELLYTNCVFDWPPACFIVNPLAEILLLIIDNPDIPPCAISNPAASVPLVVILLDSIKEFGASFR